MRISIAEAEGQLADLVRLAGQGEEILLTQDGLTTVRLAPVETAEPARRIPNPDLRAIIDEIQKQAAEKMTPGPSAAHSQDFLYDEDGLPA